jgi:nucleoside-diphosphate-sugar epimerase
MRVVIIGGTGHIGSYLSPRLVESGHTVLCVSRGQRKPYHDHGAWNQISIVELDRDAEESRGDFGERIARLEPEAVIDLTCYTPESAAQLVEGLRGRLQHFLHCGTVWVHGPSVQVPTTEEEPRRPFGEYGCRKSAIENYLLDQARRHNFPATVLHPGHIVGSGWVPLNPAGNFNPQVFSDLAAGREVLLPNIGLETVHHVHADDVAQGFMRALARRSVALGESFHLVSPAAVTLRGYAERMALWFGQTARLKFLPWDDFCKSVSGKDAEKTWDHIAHSPNCSIQKARALLGYQPRYSSLEAVQESVTWLMGEGRVSRA